MRLAALACLMLCALAACSYQQLYATGRNAQRAACMKLADELARNRCFQDAGMPYDTYRKEADAARE